MDAALIHQAAAKGNSLRRIVIAADPCSCRFARRRVVNRKMDKMLIIRLNILLSHTTVPLSLLPAFCKQINLTRIAGGYLYP